METHIKEITKQFFVDKDKKTTVCKLTCKIPITKKFSLVADVIDFVSYTGKIQFVNALQELNVMCKNNEMYFTVYGKSKCHKNDEFDESIGYMLSLTKAQSKAFKKASKIYNVLFDTIYTVFCDKLDELAANCSQCGYDCDEHCEEIVGK